MGWLLNHVFIYLPLRWSLCTSLYHFCSIINALVSCVPLWWWWFLFVDRCHACLLVCDAKWQLYGGVHHIFVPYAFLFNFVSLMVYVYLCLALLFIPYWYCPSVYLDPLAILTMQVQLHSRMNFIMVHIVVSDVIYTCIFAWLHKPHPLLGACRWQATNPLAQGFWWSFLNR